MQNVKLTVGEEGTSVSVVTEGPNARGVLTRIEEKTLIANQSINLVLMPGQRYVIVPIGETARPSKLAAVTTSEKQASAPSQLRQSPTNTPTGPTSQQKTLANTPPQHPATPKEPKIETPKI